ncbi:alpha,alpha-trehalose-phosphate synthase (UDP-forming) [Fundidesulfovibrio soli]|uniref:alpha,alpha-trehalose-phosphate synthase (UDP-forming) n=1 Tax=Fundidesulfovibrio soli TaxID=2922716 RepID=UPI001FAEA52F|nr:trehalose-6-phosphate synthase [Fundidesulfovibrio soli]
MPNESRRDKRLVVVSNRLPVSVVREAGALRLKQGAGGLVTAMAPVLRDRGGLWIGWPGAVEKDMASLCREFSREAGYLLRPVELDEEDVDGFYHGFSNEILWPLFHEFLMPCNFDPSFWEAYKRANAKFSAAVAAATKPGDFVWVHDYHLMLLAAQAKEAGRDTRMGFFLHIPFPPADIFLKLPWRKQIIDALLEFDLLGFQTVRDRVNFFEAVQRIYPKAYKRGRGQVISVSAGGKQTRLGSFPISIDFRAFVNAASQPASQVAAEQIRKDVGDRYLLFGADRQDYSKGIPERIAAFGQMLRMFPELKEKVCFIQIIVPSRENVPMYREIKTQVESMVSEINGRHATPGWTPLHYFYRNLPHEELIHYYRAADVALVTPLRDGMNLVAKEYVACNTRENGTLILSEFAGAAMEFHRHALMVNPFDTLGTAEAIRRAMDISPAVRKRHMRALRDIVRRFDIFHWVDSYLMAAISKRLGDFPTKQGDFYQTIRDRLGPPWDAEDDSASDSRL